MRPWTSVSLALTLLAIAPESWGQLSIDNRCKAYRGHNSIEFIAPMPTEEVPVFHGPMPAAWHVILEMALEQDVVMPTRIFEGQYLPSPGISVAVPTDLNGNGTLGDRHPAFPDLVLSMDDDLMVAGVVLPGGTNLASFVELIGSEIEHGGEQSTTVSWIVDAGFTIIDTNGDGATVLFAAVGNARDTVTVTHGFDPVYQPCSLPSTPTTTLFTADWISTIDRDVLTSDGREAFFVGYEVRIPCYFDSSTTPPTPIPLDPIPGPGFGGMVVTGNFPLVPGPGPHPSWPTVYLTFSDDYFDVATGSGVGGGIVTGGTCATIYGVTGPNLAFAFEQASVSAWYGVDGVPNLAPGTVADDQLIYRFTMIGDGMIIDSDILPREMMITATVETECNLFSITNTRVKHKRKIQTPNPNP